MAGLCDVWSRAEVVMADLRYEPLLELQSKEIERLKADVDNLQFPRGFTFDKLEFLTAEAKEVGSRVVLPCPRIRADVHCSLETLTLFAPSTACAPWSTSVPVVGSDARTAGDVASSGKAPTGPPVALDAAEKGVEQGVNVPERFRCASQQRQPSY